jgi:hypothetical protein
VFLSNPTRTVAIWQQRLASHPQQPVVWDYHVICLRVAAPLPDASAAASPPDPHVAGVVYDLDSRLQFPTPFVEYMAKSFHPNTRSQYQPTFRVIDAVTYLQRFSSDRSHMLTADGHYQSPPPIYPAIIAEGEGGNNLQQLISMQAFEGFGVILTPSQLTEFVLEGSVGS